jgi:hypothetical protein
MSFPSLTTITSTAYNLPFYIGDHLALTSLLFGNLTSFKPTQFFMVNTRLSSASVNSLLHSFTTITPPMTGKYLSLQQVPPAPPTGQGLADKAMLIANGNTVITD